MKSNESILDSVKKERKLMKEIIQGELKFIGHAVRGDGSGGSILDIAR